jgi:hypothetical protein
MAGAVTPTKRDLREVEKIRQEQTIPCLVASVNPTDFYWGFRINSP